MTLLIEGAKKLLARKNRHALVPTFEFQGESGWQDSESNWYREWCSPDGKHRIFVVACGGPEYGGIFMQDIHLRVKGEMASGEMMRVQAVSSPDRPGTKYNVYLDVIDETEKMLRLSHIAYFWDNGGRASPPHAWKFIMKREEDGHLSDEEFRQLRVDDLKKSGIHHSSEVLPEINIKATVDAFLEQIRKHDFSKLQLVPKYSGIKEQTVLGNEM